MLDKEGSCTRVQSTGLSEVKLEVAIVYVVEDLSLIVPILEQGVVWRRQ